MDDGLRIEKERSRGSRVLYCIWVAGPLNHAVALPLVEFSGNGLIKIWVPLAGLWGLSALLWLTLAIDGWGAGLRGWANGIMLSYYAAVVVGAACSWHPIGVAAAWLTAVTVPIVLGLADRQRANKTA